MNHTTNPQAALTAAVYDALVSFQKTAKWPQLALAQMRQHLAEHVAAALPSVVVSADRATLLREAADELGRMDYDADSSDYGYDTYRDAWNGGVMDAAEVLRRRAAEEQPAEMQEALMQAHTALAAQAGRDQRAVARVRQLHDALAAETALTSPDDEITRGAAARKIAAALDGDRPAVVEQPFGSPDCTCIPFTRQGGKPRTLGPDDTVDMISGWERRSDCPHHRPAVVEQPDTQTREARVGRCSAVMLRVHHAPHGWEPQPGMDPVHCPGYPQPAP